MSYIAPQYIDTIVEGIYENVPPIIHQHILCSRYQRPGMLYIKAYFFRVWRDVISNFFRYKRITDIIDPQPGVEIAAV